MTILTIGSRLIDDLILELRHPRGHAGSGLTLVIRRRSVHALTMALGLVGRAGWFHWAAASAGAVPTGIDDGRLQIENV